MTQNSKPLNRRVLVIGGGGFIGRHVCDALTKDGAHVAVVDVAPPPQDNQYDWISGSVSDASLITAAATGCATVIFLANASLPGSAIANLSTEVESHVRDTIRTAEACAAIGVRRFLFASSGGTVYGHAPAEGAALSENAPTVPRNAYGVSKLSIEHYLRLLSHPDKMRTVSLRISNPYGEGQRANRGQGFVAAAMQKAMTGEPIEIWGDGSVVRDFLHVDDVSQAFVKAERAEAPAPVVNIGSGEGVSLRDLLGMIEVATGRTIDVSYVEGRTIDVARNVLDVARAAQELNWQPRISLQDGLARTADWWK